MHTLTRILVPTDFSDVAQQAFEYALVLAQEVGASVELLYVWEPARDVGPDTMVLLPGEQAFALGRLVERRAQDEIQAFLTPNQGGPVKVGGRVESGSPTETLLRVATEQGFDLIGMGTHGFSGWKLLLAKSVAEHIVRAAPCPVVTLRAG